MKNIDTPSKISSVSGSENAFAAALIEQLPEYCRYKQDALGNLIVYKQKSSDSVPKVMISAPMDESGFLISSVSENGSLKFVTVGTLPPQAFFGKRVRVGKSEILGVIGGKPIHLLKEKERDVIPPKEELFIDIGAKTKEEALQCVQIGDRAVLECSFGNFGKDKIKGRGLHRMIGSEILMNLLKSEDTGDFAVVFSVQSMAGHGGIATASYSVQPEIALFLDTVKANDFPENGAQDCALGKGAVLSFMDKGVIYDTGLFQIAAETAKAHNIPIQFSKAPQTGLEAAEAHTVRSGIKTLTVGIPCRYHRGINEVVSLTDVENAETLVKEMIRKLTHD